MLNIDWFQPYAHTTYSVGVIYLTIMNLPRHLRFKQQYVILLGVIPGPCEPKHDINSFLKPLVEELLDLWSGVKFSIQTSSSVIEETVRCALLCIACDLPAVRKVCGFLGHSARLGCSKCSKEFPGEPGCMDYSGFDRSKWPPRTDREHREKLCKIKNCKSKSEQAKAESSLGCRYSVLLDIPYFNAPRHHIIDPMHNLFLGTGKHMIEVWINNGYLSNSNFRCIQKCVDQIILPSDVGRIPYKIQSGFAGFKADQFKIWITVYSIPSLFGVLPADHLECWRHFVLACRLLCKQCLTHDEVSLADALLIHFCKRVEHLYTKEAITPNMHMHGHLKEVILDYGPIQEFWLFSFERYNGILGKQPSNNRLIEPQLMSRFLNDNFAHSFTFPEEFADEFSSLSLKENVVGSVFDTLTLQEFKLPTKYSQGVFGAEEVQVVSQLYSQLYPEASNITVNSVFIKYTKVVLKGRTFGSCGKGTHKSKACVCMALWDPSLYGPPPTSLPTASGMVNSNHRPVKVHHFLKATFFDTGACPNQLLLAQVSWFFPFPDRFAVGKPAELWCTNMFESFGKHSFVPLQSSNLVCRCAYGPMEYHDESLLVIVPLVE